MGRTLDALHIPFAIAVMSFGPLWMPMAIWWPMMATIIGLQIVFLGCPLIPLTVWLKHRLYPEHFYARASFTLWLYGRYGRKAFIAPALAFAAVAVTVWLV